MPLPVDRRRRAGASVHVPADREDQVSTVFDLIVGVLVTEPAALLLVEVEREAHTGVNPTLADLAQSPYSPMVGQGVCDLRQTRGVRDSSKAVSFLGEDMPALRAWQATYSWPFKIT